MRINHGTPGQLLGELNVVEKKFAPEVLYFCGKKDLLKVRPRISIIGSRKASIKGIELASRVSSMICSLGGIVVSGLAEGIDTAAHKAAIDVDGETIGVIGTPLDRFYPKENQNLQKKLMTEHLVISQFSSGQVVNKQNFVMRNRTMALISHATIIIEAGEQSGTTHQGWEALRLRRTLFLQEALVSTTFDWPKKMIDSYGAIVFRGEYDLKKFILELLPPQKPMPNEQVGLFHEAYF